MDGTRSTAAYSRFAEEMDIDSDAVEVNTQNGHTGNGKLGTFKDCFITRWRLWGIICLCTLSFLFGFLLTHMMVTSCAREPGTVVPPTGPPVNNSTGHHKGEGRKYADEVSDYIRIGNFEKTLKLYTEFNNSLSFRHDSASPAVSSYAYYIRNAWFAYKFNVQTKDYNVQLTRPVSGPEQTRLEISGDNGEVIKIVPGNDGDSSDLLKPFVVNSPSTNPEGLAAVPIFINYGRPEDFFYLTNEADREVSGKVCFVKLGMVQLPILVDRCAKHGGLGVIAYPDPDDYVNGMYYPDGPGLPENASIIDNASPLFGDPKTPSLPSIEDVQDSTDYNVSSLPTMIISQLDASRLLKLMSNPPAPESWAGGLTKYANNEEQVYFIGGDSDGFQRPQTMKMFVNNQVVERSISNMFGTITGTVEPDRYVIFGCHRDSLSRGSVEPGTGMAVFMELSRLVHQLRQNGWEPRRTVIFASWDGGDDGHIGSTEWVEENREILNQRAVVYVNLDEAVSGSYSFAAEGSPLFAKALLNATRQVDSPDSDHPDMSVFDTWRSRNPGSSAKNYQLRPLGINSDATPFLHLAGVPSVDLKYTYSKNGKHIPKYPLWHTSYDTPDYVKSNIDPGWNTHKAMTDIAAHILLMYAGDIVLPVDVNDYATTIKSYATKLSDLYADGLDVSFAELNNCIEELREAAQKFHSKIILSLNVSNDMQVREANDRLVAMERAFLSTEGGTHMYPQLRHMIHGPSSEGAYDAEGLSPLSFALRAANTTKAEVDLQRARSVMSATTVAIHKAAVALMVDELFT